MLVLGLGLMLVLVLGLVLVLVPVLVRGMVSEKASRRHVVSAVAGSRLLDSLLAISDEVLVVR